MTADGLAAGGQAEEATGSPDAAGTPPVLALDGVSVRRGGRQILHEVGFTLAAGEFAGLIGSNGAGKTTILRVVLGLQPPSGGTVLVDGRRLGRRNRSVGYVPQKVLIDPDAPVRARDLVALGLDGGRLGVRLPSRRRRQLVDEMLAAVDAARFADVRVGALSGGEQQRVLIAHALISRPRLLLMDEPLANLDIRSGQEIVALLARVAREQRVAVLLSAHDMNPLLPVLDRVVYVAGGRVAAGTSEEVVRTEVLSALYGHPVHVLRVDGRVLVVSGSQVTVDPEPRPPLEPSGRATPSAAEPPSTAGDSTAAEPPPAADHATAAEPPPAAGGPTAAGPPAAAELAPAAGLPPAAAGGPPAAEGKCVR